MSCFCSPKAPISRRLYLHWDNFTFNHEEEQLKRAEKHRTQFRLHQKLRHRHTLAPEHLSVKGRPKDCRKYSSGGISSKTVPMVVGEKYQPPQGPPPSHRRLGEEYQPPPGPPPSHRQNEQYQPPSGPPPSKEKSEVYQPPPGPPPSHKQHDEEPPPYDPWLAVPDNATLPPPPSFFQTRSNTANAAEDEAVAAHRWCDRNPPWRARQLHPQAISKRQVGDYRLTTPPGAANVELYSLGQGRTHVRTNARCKDTIMLSDIPKYAADYDSPLLTERPTVIYFEVHVLKMGNPRDDGDAGIAIGYLAPPYPPWRLPGWHRASLGIHGDDGRRYVNNTFGGQEFTAAFEPGQTVGVGMVFEPPRYATEARLRCRVFFTRNGKESGGWDLNEERDQEAGPSGIEGDPAGLGGDLDLLAAVGCFGACEFEVRFRSEDWLYRT